MNASHSEAGNLVSPIEYQHEILDSELQKRHKERSTLRRQSNAAESPCVRDVPLEILSHIFEYTCSPIDLNDPARALRPRVGFHLGRSNAEPDRPYLPIDLCSVSSYWRDVALKTPRIWTKVVIEVSARRAESRASLLHFYLQNSQAQPCNVELDFQREQQDRLSPDHDATKIERRVEVALQPIARVLFHRDNATKPWFLQFTAVPFSWLPRLSEFFRHLPRFTTTLHLTGGVAQNLGEERLPHLFTVLHLIQHLYLEELNERSRLIPIMKALGQPFWTDSIEGAGLSTLPFPNLHTISFILDNENSHARPDEHLEFIEALIGIIWMRFEDSHDARLRIELNVELDWPDNEDSTTEAVIGWVAESGLVLDIREKGQIVEWVNLVKAKAKVQIP